MIQINLQWLAYPCWLLSAYLVLYGLYSAVVLAGTSDIGPALGIVISIRSIFNALCAGVVGWLIWRAFR